MRLAWLAWLAARMGDAGLAEEALSADFSAQALDGKTVPAEDMASDIHADQEYRAHLVIVMAKRAVAAAK